VPAPAADPISTLASRHLSGFAADVVAGRHLDLLAPLSLVAPGTPPAGAAPATADRVELAAGLAAANAAAGHPRAAELAAKLARAETAVVVTGQQTGLFGGPLLALVKAAAATRWAEALEAAGRPAVAVFWMATEDHDFAEVAQATVLGPDGPLRLTLGEDPQPLAPVGLRTVGPAVAGLLEQLRARFPSEWFRAWVDRLALWWRPEARFGEAFAATLTALLGARAPLFLDSMAPALKLAQRPFLTALVERRAAHAAALAAREAELAARGLPLQVAPQPGASPLFLVRGRERRRIEWRGETRFALRGLDGEWPVEELLATIADNPSAVSPGVLARPAVQDAVLGARVFVVGPGELAYLPQASAAHAVLGVAPPAVALRPHALVLDERSRAHLEELGATVAELLAGPEAIAARLAARAGADFAAPVRAAVERELDRLREPALALDAGLGKPWEKTHESVLRALDAFAARVEAAGARRDETGSHRLAQLVSLSRPGDQPQERVLASAWFAGRWGEGFAARLIDQLDLDARRLSLVDPG
jgi:bacillithiol biosynthesis cysteine-adding enzyme BshC